ncbi:MAG: dihydropteroate synthase [Candidatus Saccharicenans sp.]|nr:dihydropteroate synthase [Candidatus Saccharicenans sp.]MDI6848577.1 dihydropteroate synthase [Candidatus Saccharicenans sp.]
MLIIIGELLNSSRRSVEEAFLNKNADYLLELAVEQEKAGCSYLDLNASTLFDGEPGLLTWIIPSLQEKVSIPLSIDSTNPVALEAGLKVHRGRALLNSIPGKQKEMEEIIPLIRDYRPQVIVSCLDDGGFPETPERTVAIAERILNRLFSQTSVVQDDIFLDLLARPLAVTPGAGRQFLETLLLVRKELPGFKTVAGLSNVSYGLPRRRVVNLTFLTNLIGHGLSAVIADPLHPDFKATVIVSEFLNNRPGARERFLAWARSEQKED